MESTNKTTTSFKIYFDDRKDVRRVSLPFARFDSVIAALQQLYAPDGLYHPELRIQYFDSEGDKCTVSSQVEWEEMIQQLVARPIKLYITDSSHQGRYFKDGPPPVAQYFYTESEKGDVTNTEEPPKIAAEGEILAKLEFAVPKCLERLFPGGKILPYHLPDWLRDGGCVELRRVDENDNSVVDLDIDVCKLFDVLHRQSLACFGDDETPRDLARAKDFIYSMLTITPHHPLALYNLACAEALLGNQDAAAAALVQSVHEGGYSDWRHIEKDSDLDLIREHPGYIAIVAELKEQDEEEKEKKRKKEEEEQKEKDRLKKEEEERRRILEDEEKRKREEVRRLIYEKIKKEEEKKKREEEERKMKEEEEKEAQKKREVEEKQKKEEEEQKKKREEDEKRIKEEEEKKKSEEEEQEKKKKAEVEKQVRDAAREVRNQKVIDESMWKEQLTNLVEMGFDAEVCEFLLSENNGDVQMVLYFLLQAQYPSNVTPATRKSARKHRD